MTTLQKIIKYFAIAVAIGLIVSIIGGIAGVAGLFGGSLGDEGVSDTVKEYTVGSQIRDLEIEINAADLTIQYAQDFRVESNLAYLDVSDENGCLSITETRKKGLRYEDAMLTLYIPEGFAFEEVEINTGAGELTAEVLNAGALTLDLGAGKVEIGQLNASEEAVINGGAGAVTISGGVLNDLDLDMGVGELDMTAALLGESELNYGVGKAELTLLGTKEDYTVTFNKGLGSAVIDGRSVDDGAMVGTGTNRVEIDGGVGASKVSFREIS